MKKIKKFFLPDLTPAYLTRLALIAVFSFIFFKWICVPERIQGESMEPTYRNGSFNFCWRPAYLFSRPARGDVVMVRFSGEKIMLLKRIVALEGEKIEFRNGALYVNDAPLREPYVKLPCDWSLEPRTVEKGKVYVVGDNRSMHMDMHQFGQVSMTRIAGKPLW